MSRARGWVGETPHALSVGALLTASIILLCVSGCGSSSSQSRTGSGTPIGTNPTGPHVVLVYRAREVAAQPVTAANLTVAVEIMRERVAQLGVTQSEIRRSGADEITVVLPDTSSAPVAAEPVVQRTAQLFFYDWEPNVIGPDGKPAPFEAAVTGGSNAGSATYGLPEFEAVQRAAKREPILRLTDTTWQQGCTSAQLHGCIYGSWYLLDTKHKKVLCSGKTVTCAPAETEAALYSGGYKPPAGAVAEAVRVNPGTVLVRSRPEETATGRITVASPNSWYVLNDEPVLNGADITNPVQSYDEGASGTPTVTFEFTPHGKPIFEQITKKIAHRGQETKLPGVSTEAAEQHFAIVLDGQLVTVPSIDFEKYPEGIDASTGSEISGDLTLTSARELADELHSGALPVSLMLVSRSYVPGG